MKRGFLNSKKVRHQPSYDNGAPTANLAMVAPLKHLGDSATAISRPEPAVGFTLLDDIPVNSRTLEPYAVVCIPSLKLTKSKEPSSTCILRASTCATIVNTPGFYTPLPPLNPMNVVFTKSIPNMGVGLFAKCSVKVREVVFSERPLLVFPRGMLFYRIPGLSKEEAIKKNESMFEEKLQQALSAMTKEDVDAFMSLSNCHLNSPELYGIAMTNAFGTGTDIEKENLEEGKFEYAAVGRLASRINHSCIPNIRVDFDVPTFSLRVIAQRDIKAGEQIFYCYCQGDRSVKERQRQLATYGFVCQCKACANATPESDKLREERDDRLQKIFDQQEEMYANPRFGIRSLDPLLKLEKDIVKEGLDFGEKFVQLLIIIFQAYGKLNNRVKEMEYYNKAHKYRGQTN